MVRKILPAKDPFLRLTAKPVVALDKKVFEIIKDLKDTLAVQKDPEGVGLAAPQIGKNIRIFYLSHKGKSEVFINPEILYKAPGKVISEKENEKIMEGCLSLPYYYGSLLRSPEVKVKYMNESGLVKIRKITGFPAQIVQHEVDHLNGILFVDKLLKQKRKLYKINADEDWEEVDL